MYCLLEDLGVHEASVDGEAVHATVGLSLATDGTGKAVHVVVAGVDSVLVDLANVDRDGGVVLGSEEGVGDAAARKIISSVGVFHRSNECAFMSSFHVQEFRCVTNSS